MEPRPLPAPAVTVLRCAAVFQFAVVAAALADWARTDWADGTSALSTLGGDLMVLVQALCVAAVVVALFRMLGAMGPAAAEIEGRPPRTAHRRATGPDGQDGGQDDGRHDDLFDDGWDDTVTGWSAGGWPDPVDRRPAGPGWLARRRLARDLRRWLDDPDL